MENINEKDLAREVNSYISTVISQAKEIVYRTEVNQLSQIQGYNVDSARTYIDKMTGQIDNARERYELLKNMPNSHFWTVGRNKAKTEQTQEVIEYAIDAIDNNALATKALFNNQILLANASKQLYALGVMGITSNRIVVREIKLRLKNASQEELDDLARKELESVVKELEKQKALEEKIDNLTDAIGKRATPYSAATGIMKVLQKYDDDLQKHYDDLKKHDDILKENKDAIRSTESDISKLFDKASHLKFTIEHYREEAFNNINVVSDLLSDLSSEHDKKHKQIENETNNHQKRLEQLENKSFIDSTFYKIIVGLCAVGAFVLSILNYFS